MATYTNDKNSSQGLSANRSSASVDELLLAAMERGSASFETGRYLITFKEGAAPEGIRFLAASQGLRVADARDFDGQAATLEQVGDADAVFFPAIGVTLLGGEAAQERNLGAQFEPAPSTRIESVNPEYFAFAHEGFGQHVPYSNSLVGRGLASHQVFDDSSGLTEFGQATTSSAFLNGFLQATQTIDKEVRGISNGYGHLGLDMEEEIQVLGATWGLNACKVPASTRSASGIKVAVLSSGFDLGHPDFVGRPIVSQTFVGQPVQDLYGHGTHMVGTACGPKSPAGTTPRYGIGFRSSIFVGKVLNNSGAGTTASILAGMNWAIANRCPVILVPIATPSAVIPAFTAAGQAALNNGCLIIAGSAGQGASVGAPANSPTIMSVAAVDQNFQPAPFSPVGKIDIAAPGVSIFSAYPRPRLYQTWSGIASAAAHVAGCAALWAETSPSLRGLALRQKLEATAKRYPPFFPPYPPKHPRLGAGLVQAP